MAVRYGRFEITDEPRETRMGVMELLAILIALGVLIAVIAAGVILGIYLSKRRRRDTDPRPPRTG